MEWQQVLESSIWHDTYCGKEYSWGNITESIILYNAKLGRLSFRICIAIFAYFQFPI